MRREKIAVAGPNVRLRCGTRAAAKHILVAHELAVVLAECAFGCSKPWVRRVRTRCPFPAIAKKLRRAVARGAWMQSLRLQQVAAVVFTGCGVLPFELSGQPRAAPASVGIGLQVADMVSGLVPVE